MEKNWFFLFVRRNLKSLKTDLSPLDIFPLVLQENICGEKVLNFIVTNVLQHPRPRNLVLTRAKSKFLPVLKFFREN